MKSFNQLLKLTLVLMVLVTSSLRPNVVYANNSHNNSLMAMSKKAHHSSAKCSLTKPVKLSRAMKILDKEKNKAVCLTPKIQKEVFVSTKPAEFKPSVGPINAVSPQLQVLRI